MTITSSNAGSFMKPVGGMLSRGYSGKMYKVDDILKNKKVKKKKTGMYELCDIEGLVLVESKKDRKYRVNGKMGVWRTIKGRYYFFPDDGSDTIPPMKF